MIRKAQWFWDIVAAENGMGAHNPGGNMNILGQSIDLAHQAIEAAAQAGLASAAPSEVNGASAPEAAAKPKKNTIKGVNEYYAACAIRLPAHGKRPSADAGLLPARPVALTEKGLVVELIESE